MPIASRTQVATLNKWFPPNDPLTAKIARLCILREDFLFEMNGIYMDKIKELDGLSEEWRRLYFVRNLIRTLREIEGGIQRLLSDPEFEALLAGQKPERQEEFEDHARAVAQGVAVVNEVRNNDICGHVREAVVQQTLDELAGSDVFGFLEIGPTMQRTYFKFVGEFI